MPSQPPNREMAQKVSESEINQKVDRRQKVQTFDDRYIDTSRLETLLISLHGKSNFKIRRILDTWHVEAPELLTAKQIEALRH